MKVTYTEEAVADIVEAITYLNERNPAAAVNLAAEIVRCIERLADREFEGPVSRLRSGAISSSLTYHSPITIAPGAKSRTYTLRVPVSSELYAIHFSSDDHGRERPVAPDVTERALSVEVTQIEPLVHNLTPRTCLHTICS